MKLLIIRHGETYDNVLKRIQGQTHGELTERGKQQAEALAERLLEEKIDRVYSSDLGRVKQTLVPLLARREIDVSYVPELRERRFGVFEGRLLSEYREKRKLEAWDRFNCRTEGGESYEDVRARLSPWLSRIIEESRPEESIVLFSHGGTILFLFSLFFNVPP